MKLNQVIAVEKGIKAKAHSEVTELHKLCQKPELFNGFAKVYQKIDDGGEDMRPLDVLRALGINGNKRIAKIELRYHRMDMAIDHVDRSHPQ